MFMLFGCGTTLYGRAKTSDGRGRIATKWFCLINIPIVPIKSYLITEEVDGPDLVVWQSTNFSLAPLDHLFRRHVLVWGLSWLTFIATIWILTLLTPAG